ncbi:MAG: HD domain-containing protein [Anaerolineae bacterium]|nr:HD domain-containing protein [Anaerolineae bacterium]
MTEQAIDATVHVDAVIALIAAQGRPAWLVGGSVRDRLLGRPTHDLDVIVSEGGVRLARLIANAFDGAYFVLDAERDVGRAILRNRSGETLEVDVARLRSPQLVEDLSLRDFTINAMAQEITAAGLATDLVDPFDGRGDLRRRLVRAVTEGSLRDDPLRCLRAVRQAIELGFRIEEATYNLIRRDASLLTTVAGERVRDELLRIVAAPGAWQHMRLLADLAILPAVLPEAAALIGVTQSPPHYQDAFDHTRSVMAHLEGILALLWPERYAIPAAVADDATVIAPAGMWADVSDLLASYRDDLRSHLLRPLAAGRTRRDWLLWAALAHDWGKPAMRTVDANGGVHFYEHDQWGAVLVQHRGEALKLASDEIAYLGRLVEGHMRPTHLAHDDPPSRRALYRYYVAMGDAGPECALLSLADSMATRAAPPDPEHWRRRFDVTGRLLHVFFRERQERLEPPLLLNGHQLMAEFGLTAGPQIGRLLDGLREAQAIGEVTTLAEARAWLAERIRAR